MFINGSRKGKGYRRIGFTVKELAKYFGTSEDMIRKGMGNQARVMRDVDKYVKFIIKEYINKEGRMGVRSSLLDWVKEELRGREEEKTGDKNP